MSNNVTFHVAYTVTTDVSAQDIWAIWVDVNNWNKWDHGIAHSELSGSFNEGSRFVLTPQGGEPIDITLKTVTQGEAFSDEAHLPFGSIRNVHHMRMVGRKLQVTHEVYADIDEASAQFFGNEIWPHMQSGLPEAVNNLILLAQRK
ncbi:SRPBCC family protein [Advenella mimigardefordensis]|uniref:START-like domain-containing protein n=1 Tax=Advenella mimigardefordensis (strain DSM 17166 / LMG 22922 / DPN7) TaxID=1247726 RepID=W0PCY1_ADVMD|nr:SRPBCC family protein [Advenella mimigardefordensis]AHG64724.1 START-like domain-containing protein [Advenella mimigardefordensis DPN7]